MLKSNLIAAIQFEIRKHVYGTLMEDGLVFPVCETSKKKLFTQGQFADHICEVIPGLFDRISDANKKASQP
jgi:hypothetical protein